MGFLSKFFGNKEQENKSGGMQDYMTLVRVYLQAALAAHLGISNLAMLPDLRVFKTSLKVPTQNNKLGLGEKSYCKKMMKEIYGCDDDFFKEIDQSIRRNCKKLQDMQVYLIQFQNFSQDLMMVVGDAMKFKLRVPSFFKSALHSMTEKTVKDIFEKNNYSDASIVKSVMGIRKYNQRLGFSQKWVTEFVFEVLMLAKKEPRAGQKEQDKA